MKNTLVKIQSPDGEIHFQECKATFCATYPKYNTQEALNIAKKEAKKPLLLNQKNQQ